MFAENETVDTKATEESTTAAVPEAKNEIIEQTETPMTAGGAATDIQAPVKRKKEKRDRPRKRRPASGMVKVAARFAACGRCSFFLAGYKALVGEEALEMAVSQRGHHWLRLPWNQSATDLLHKSYGRRVEADCFHYEGICRECRRHFIYEAPDAADEPPQFRIELKQRRHE